MMIMFRTLGFRCQVVLHANHAIGMMMMGDNRYNQHDHADEKEKRDYVPFIPHS
ncbi:hypothetical protein M081_3740 [Bacteroides fragilis str. 3998 T(B) 4]|nr:hypothetical protein M081_3740 [Bacteroides fragilis str. 3998 T(B) 4]